MAKRPAFRAATLARMRLSDIASVGMELRRRGGAFPTAPLLRVITNLLSSVPRSQIPSRSGPKPPLYYLDLIAPVVVRYAFDAGVRVCPHEATKAIKETMAWRRRLAMSRGRIDRRPMSMDAIGKELGITPELREAAQAWSIGTDGGTPGQRAKARQGRETDRLRGRRRDAGTTPRAEYEATSLSRQKPWEAEGVSRRTWYRRQRVDAKNMADANQPVEEIMIDRKQKPPEAAKDRRKRNTDSQRARRRAAGAIPRADYVAGSLSQQKPWEAEGICRRTWERRRKATG